MRGITEIIRLIAELMPAWLLIPLLVGLGLLLVPVWFHTVRIKQIRGTFRVLARTTDRTTRDQLIEQAFALASKHPKRLVAIAEIATTHRLQAVTKRALQALSAAGGHPADLARLEHRPKTPTPIHPLHIAARVDTLIDQGLVEAAREQLQQGEARYPSDPDLAQARTRLQDAIQRKEE